MDRGASRVLNVMLMLAKPEMQAMGIRRKNLNCILNYWPLECPDNTCLC